MKSLIPLFNYGRNNRLALARIISNDCQTSTGWWLSGRVFGRYVSIYIPWFPHAL